MMKSMRAQWATRDGDEQETEIGEGGGEGGGESGGESGGEGGGEAKRGAAKGASSVAVVLQLICLALAAQLLVVLVVSSSSSPQHDAHSRPASHVQAEADDPVAVYKAEHGADPPPAFDPWIQFANRSGCSTDVRFYSQIYRDLKPWRKDGIPNNFLDTVKSYSNVPYYNAPDVTVVSFSSGKFSNYGGLWVDSIPHVLEPIQSLFASHKDFKFILNGLDMPRHVWEPTSPLKKFETPQKLFKHSDCFRDNYFAIRETHAYLTEPGIFDVQNTRAPVISQTKLSCYTDILIPLVYHQNIALEGVRDPIPWSQKKRALFWRGANRGGVTRLHSVWQGYQRYRLVDWAYDYVQEHPGVAFDAGKDEEPPATGERNVSIDIGFHNLIGDFWDEPTGKLMQQRYPLKHEVSFSKTLQFKYLIVVDGHAWPSRFQSYLQTNSVILYNGIFTDFFNWRLTPWVHYVPVKTDYSDLEEVLDWLQANDDKAEQITKNAQALMKDINRIEHLQCYTSLMLLEYARLYEKGGN